MGMAQYNGVNRPCRYVSGLRCATLFVGPSLVVFASYILFSRLPFWVYTCVMILVQVVWCGPAGPAVVVLVYVIANDQT